jgi:hypothetical protein
MPWSNLTEFVIIWLWQIKCDQIRLINLKGHICLFGGIEKRTSFSFDCYCYLLVGQTVGSIVTIGYRTLDHLKRSEK